MPSNTTLLGVGDDASLLGVNLTVNTGTNIIVRNLHLEAPADFFTSWSPDDGAQGAWNGRFDAMSVVTGRNIWIDHCTFTDGRFPDSRAPIGFHGKRAQRHDGLLDIEDGSDFITVSAARFVNHDKTLLIGSGDGRGDRGRLRITFERNLFADSSQPNPRVRFGKVHVYNNYFTGSTDDPEQPLRSEALGGASYHLGLGLEPAVVSEFNALDYSGPGASPDIIVSLKNAHRFLDRGSWFNGRAVDVNALAERKFEQARAQAIADAEAHGRDGPPVPRGRTTGWEPSGDHSGRRTDCTPRCGRGWGTSSSRKCRTRPFPGWTDG